MKKNLTVNINDNYAIPFNKYLKDNNIKRQDWIKEMIDKIRKELI